MSVMILCITMVMSLVPGTVFAEIVDTGASEEVRITKAQAIKLTQGNKGKAILMNEYGEGYEVDVTYQDKLVQGLRSSGGEQIYSRTICMDTASISPLSTTDLNYREKWDSTGSVKANSTIYFKTKNTPTEYLLTKVSVGYTISEPRVRIVDQALVAGCTGTYPSVG